MAILGIDLGGTKLSLGVFEQSGKMIFKQSVSLETRVGTEVGNLIVEEIKKILRAYGNIQSIGIAVPGIYHEKRGTVWAPNIPGWDDYPLLKEMENASNIPVTIDSDRACYILGEAWMGNAKNCHHAIYLAVGTGIGAGILVDGKVLRGAHDIAGAIGWMALQPPFHTKFIDVGNFEFYASGEGIARGAKEVLSTKKNYKGVLAQKDSTSITSRDVFAAEEQGDQVAREVLQKCIQYWGMAAANLISLFNPEKIIFGGGVFGPAMKFISAIREEADKWAQPISKKQVSIEGSALGTDAGLYGAALLALQRIHISGKALPRP
jgi:glucokinase